MLIVGVASIVLIQAGFVALVLRMYGAFAVTSLLAITIFLQHSIGAASLVLDLDFINYELPNSGVVIKGFIINTVVSLQIMITALLFKISKRRNDLANKTIMFARKRGVSRIVLIILLLISNLTFIKYLNEVGIENIAVLNLIMPSGIINLAQMREGMTNAFGTSYNWYAFLMYDLAGIVIASIYISRILNKRSTILPIALILGYCMLLFTSLQKAPILEYIIVLVICRGLIGEIKIKNILLILASAGAVLGAVYVVLLEDKGVVDILNVIINRIVVGQHIPVYYYIEFFDSNSDYLLGQTLPNPMGIFPFVPYDLTRNMALYISGDSENIGSAPTIFWGELYGNFGFYLFPFVLILNFMMLVVDKYLISKLVVWGPFGIASAAFVINHYRGAANTSISNYLIDFKMIMYLLVFIITIHSTKILRKWTHSLRNQSHNNARKCNGASLSK